MEKVITQEVIWYHIAHNKPEKGISVYIGGQNCVDIAEIVVRKGISEWKLYGRKGYVDFDKYPYWHYPEPPFKSDDSVGGIFSIHKERAV